MRDQGWGAGEITNKLAAPADMALRPKAAEAEWLSGRDTLLHERISPPFNPLLLNPASFFLQLLCATLRRLRRLENSIPVTRSFDSDILKAFLVVIQSDDHINRLRQISFAHQSFGLPASGRAKPWTSRSR